MKNAYMYEISGSIFAKGAPAIVGIPRVSFEKRGNAVEAFDALTHDILHDCPDLEITYCDVEKLNTVFNGTPNRYVKFVDIHSKDAETNIVLRLTRYEYKRYMTILTAGIEYKSGYLTDSDYRQTLTIDK